MLSTATRTQIFAQRLPCSNKTGRIHYLNMYMYCSTSWRTAQGLTKPCVCVCECVLMCVYELIGCSQCMSFLFLIFSIKTITSTRPGSKSSCTPYAQRSSVISWSLLDVYLKDNTLTSCCSKTTFCSLFSVTFLYTCHVPLSSSTHCRFHRLYFEDKPTYIQDLV